jgi:hypothetical protein
MSENTSRPTNILFIAGGFVFLALTVGFFFQMTWATALWPWPDGRLSYIFISSIAAAIAAPLFWIGFSGEFGAARGGAVNLGVSAAGMSIHLFLLNSQNPEPRLLVTAIACAIFVLINVGLYLWSSRQPIQDPRAMPAPVKISFVIFAVVLILVGTSLVLRAPTIFPWPLKPESSVMFGLIFLGASLYFITALFSARWHGARGQLLGFLAYDLILIGPFLAHFGTVAPEHRLSLIIYTLVLVYSGSVALYYLFVNKETRPWQNASLR